MENGGGERKTRVDKKIDVKPTVSIQFKNQLSTFAYLSNEPVKDIVEKLCVKGATSKPVIDEICKWFRRNYFYNNTVVVGDPQRPRLKINIQGQSAKLTTRLKREDYDLICDLSHALDITPTSTVAVLLRVGIRNVEFMQDYAHAHLMHLSEERKKKIDKFLNEIWGFKKKKE